jgi:ribose 5-phosphate isomerase A
MLTPASGSRPIVVRSSSGNERGSLPLPVNQIRASTAASIDAAVPWIECGAIGADEEKRIAAEAAAELVEDGMTVGLGTGSTVALLLPAIARRGLDGIRCVATSLATERGARELGIPVEEFSELERLDIAIDGTDQVTPDGWLVKGGGGAHQREKIVAAAAERFVVIADSSKPVDSLSPPVPLELLAFGLRSTLSRLGEEVELRDVPPSPDGGAIADYRGEIGDPATLAARLEADPGVSSHGLFPPALVSDVLVGAGKTVERLTLD